MLPGLLGEFLERDHARLEELLNRVRAAAPSIDPDAYLAFRRGLLRHIAMEEKVLLPEARRLRGGEPLGIAKQLRADHAALAALLVPSPSQHIVAGIGKVLAEHNPLEEGAEGMYQVCEELVGTKAKAMLAQIMALPEVPLAPHFDGPRAMENVARLLGSR